MPTLHERVRTRLPLDDAFAFVADFANAPRWDPGTVTSQRIDAGPVGVGARYALGVRMGRGVRPLEYRIVTHEPPTRVVLRGEGSNISAVDDIRFERDGTATVVDYTADIHLRGWMRFVEPFAGRVFERIAADAAAGMRRMLDELAAAKSTEPAGRAAAAEPAGPDVAAAAPTAGMPPVTRPADR